MEQKNCWLKNSCKLGKNCPAQCIRFLKMNKLYEEALITPKQRQHIELRLDADKSDLQAFQELSNISKSMSKFVDNNMNLLIYSKQAGNGKSSWALRMVEGYFNSIWASTPLTCRALFISVPKFLLAMKDNIDEKSEYIKHIKDNINTADIVIWDDIATKTSTVYEGEILFSMIDNRINLGKSNIYTSNLSGEEIHKALGDRLYSRIVNYSKCVKLVGKDKRGLQNELH